MNARFRSQFSSHRRLHNAGACDTGPKRLSVLASGLPESAMNLPPNALMGAPPNDLPIQSIRGLAPQVTDRLYGLFMLRTSDLCWRPRSLTMRASRIEPTR